MARRAERNFLFLQGPHGPFFSQLARKLEESGAVCWRVGFNRSDEIFWHDADSYIAHRGTANTWPAHLERLIHEKNITDIVLYGDVRSIHADAVSHARTLGIELHIFEEGYLRPKWVTYEKHGSNAHSEIMETTIAQMAVALKEPSMPAPRVPARWGDLKQHVFYGALYHGLVMAANGAYPGFQSHRGVSVAQEFGFYIKRLCLMPAHWARRILATYKIQRGAYPYHVVLMQLAHDSSFVSHSDYGSMVEFLDQVMAGFAKGAPGHHHIVFKAHPLEDGRIPAFREIRGLARKYHVEGRVHFVLGGKLAPLLDQCLSAVTVNSTAGQQVLWRGLPLKALGRAVFCKPELVSQQSLAAFFANPDRPDTEAYAVFRQYLLETSQIQGGFYSSSGRRILLRYLVDRMLGPTETAMTDPKDTAAAPQHLKLVSSGR